ncbi:ASKHA domain-containing protein [Thermanaerovibrio acidaminovorans]|uniref:ASKHA domain-containing protein n=1 Tax=Thermanaerovibrio acidaminovorans TaxID=81462 RepID=UPI0013E8BBBD|nr:ASKHA domain-containing protein [Thermanaerovibrio acidaminovorans]
MPFCKVRLPGGDRVIPFDPGASLRDVLASCGLSLGTCGGRGTCGGCQVSVSGHLPPRDPREDRLPSGRRFACLTRPLGDVEVRLDEPGGARVVPLELRVEPRALPFQVELDRGSLGDFRDIRGAIGGLASKGGLHVREVSLPALRGALELLGMRRSHAMGWVLGGRVVLVAPQGVVPVGIAADLGSSNLDLAAVDLVSGVVMGRVRVENLQRRVASDLVSRLALALEGGLEELRSLLVRSFQVGLEKLLGVSGVEPRQVVAVYCGCNPVVGDLLAGLPPSGLAESPFIPSDFGVRRLCARALGLGLDCPLVILAGMGGFVGSDALALLYGTRDLDRVPCLLMDLGTNGEVVLDLGDRVLGASTAAGPAFEGYGISCGVPAGEGAVTAVRGSIGDMELEVQGGGEPMGICGSGLISLVSFLLREGLMDGSGKLKGPQFFELRPDPPLRVTQRDLRQFQLAKGAVRAAAELLLMEAGLSPHRVVRWVVSGLLGSSVGVDDLVRVGLMPFGVEERVEVEPNGVLVGLARALASGEDGLREVEDLSGMCRVVRLDGARHFNRVLMDSLGYQG